MDFIRPGLNLLEWRMIVHFANCRMPCFVTLLFQHRAGNLSQEPMVIMPSKIAAAVPGKDQLVPLAKNAPASLAYA